MSHVSSVLTTVNAPYGEQLSGADLVSCLESIELAITKPGHVSSFLSEVSIEDQLEFASYYNLSKDVLSTVAKKFSQYSGQIYSLVA